MAALTVTNSNNIALLDSQITMDMCQGKIFVDVSPSIFVGDGAINVLGASVQIKNPYGVIVKNYPTSGYDIYDGSPAMQDVIEFSIPTQAGNYQYGRYIVTVKMTDDDGDEYEIEKSITLKAPDTKHPNRKYGTLSARLDGNCKTGRLTVIVDTPPNYNGEVYEDTLNDFNFKYPTASQQDPIVTDNGSFSAQLYEGVYEITGTICATYNLSDNVYVVVNYKVKKEKNIKCLIDKSCVFSALAALHSGISEKCTSDEIWAVRAKTIDAILLMETAVAAAESGEDASDWITELESLLGCQCTCNCLEGTPIINNAPTGNYVIAGCNVTSDITGLTTTYTINNYNYVATVNENGGILTVGDPTVNDCQKTIPFSFNINAAYSQIKTLAYTDYLPWAAVINKAWDGVDAACLGYDSTQWANLSYTQKGSAILTALCNGGVCDAEIENDATAASGSGVVFTWNEVTSVREVQIYVDDILIGTILGGVEQYIAPGIADGQAHSYAIVSKCTNGVLGNALTGTFTYSGCPVIAVPTVTLSTVSGADCPYNLTSLVNALPSGIEAEWHSANNTNVSSLVANDTAAADGVYYVFAKNADGCYSLGVKVTLVCSEDTNCSAPQSLTVEAITDGFRVRFASAAFPPSSYTVKRKPAASADVDGSYTTIGTPTYNSGVNRWEITDGSAINNTLYTYKAISNCTASTPSSLYSFANVTCPTLSLTPSNNSLAYSFVPVGGEVDKYEVEIYNSAGLSRITYDTHLPAFSNPITGTLIYLDDCTDYIIRTKVYIGTFVKICNFAAFSTVCDDYTLSASYNYSIDSVTGTGVPSPALPSTGINGLVSGVHTAMSGSYSITISGAGPGGATGVKIDATVNNVVVSTINIPSAGVYSLAVTASIGQIVRFALNSYII